MFIGSFKFHAKPEFAGRFREASTAQAKNSVTWEDDWQVFWAALSANGTEFDLCEHWR